MPTCTCLSSQHKCCLDPRNPGLGSEAWLASAQAQPHPGHLEDLLAKVSQERNASIAAATPRCFQNCWSSPSPKVQPWVGRAHGDQQILPQLRGTAEKLSKGTSLTCVCSRLTADVELNYCTELFWLFFVFTGAFVYWKRDLGIFPTVLRPGSSFLHTPGPYCC